MAAPASVREVAYPAISLRGASAFSVRCENQGGRAFLSRSSFAWASAPASSSLLAPSPAEAPLPSPSISPAACDSHGIFRSRSAGRMMQLGQPSSCISHAASLCLLAAPLIGLGHTFPFCLSARQPAASVAGLMSQHPRYDVLRVIMCDHLLSSQPTDCIRCTIPRVWLSTLDHSVYVHI